jgi:hypothetical protein
VILDGEEMRTHEQIDDHFTLRYIEKLCARHLSDADRAERKAVHDQLAVEEKAAHDQLEAEIDAVPF